MPLSDWLKSWLAEQPPEKSESVLVTESLLMELDYQMREAEERMKQVKQDHKRKISGGVDYGWLCMTREKPFEMAQLERLELEELCKKIKPDECGRVILMFRDALVREPEVHEVPRILRAVICQVLDGRPKEETMPEWVMRSITSLSKFRPNTRVSPIDIQDDSEGVSQNSTSMKSTSNVGSGEEGPTFDMVEELPV